MFESIIYIRAYSGTAKIIKSSDDHDQVIVLDQSHPV